MLSAKTVVFWCPVILIPTVLDDVSKKVISNQKLYFDLKRVTLDNQGNKLAFCAADWAPTGNAKVPSTLAHNYD